MGDYTLEVNDVNELLVWLTNIRDGQLARYNFIINSAPQHTWDYLEKIGPEACDALNTVDWRLLKAAKKEINIALRTDRPQLLKKRYYVKNSEKAKQEAKAKRARLKKDSRTPREDGRESEGDG